MTIPLVEKFREDLEFERENDVHLRYVKRRVDPLWPLAGEAKRILVCGPRAWDKPFVVFLVVAGIKINYGDDITIIHGAARGVDRMAGEAAEKLGLDVEPYPANWKFGPAAGPVRNREMLEKDIDLVIAIGYGSGTADCMRQAHSMGILTFWKYVEHRFV
jgi:hypothetical protein